MARLGAGDTFGNGSDDTDSGGGGSDDGDPNQDTGSDTGAGDKADQIEDTTPEPAPSPTSEPKQPARGGSDTSTDDAGADTNVEDRGQTIVDTGGQDTDIAQPQPEQPARGGSETDSTPAVTDPEPQQPARGRGDVGSGTGSQTGGFGYIGSVGDNTAANLNRRISRVRGNLRQRQQEARDQQVSEGMDEGVGMANRRISRARQNRRARNQEQFGDADVSFGGLTLTDEREQRDAAAEFGRFAENVGLAVSGGAGEFYSALLQGEDVQDAGDVAATMQDADRTPAAEAYGNFTEGAVSIANVPQLAVTGTEVAEYGVYAVDQYQAGELDELQAETADVAAQRGQAVVDYTLENPAEVAGTGAGALVGSAAIMGTAGSISSRAGTASRYAIQPGEELIGSAGFRATRALRGERAAQRYFPNREPVIFSEEAAIRAGRNVRSRVGSLEYQPASTRLSGQAYTPAETRFEGSEWPAEYTPARSRLGRTRGGADGPRTVQQPEELGGAGQDVVDRMYAVEAETERGDTGGLRDRIGDELREFAAAERGQQQLVGRQRTQTETESEVRQTADRVSPNLYQQSVTRQLDAEYESRMGTIEEPDVTGRFEIESEFERGRTEARTETRTDRGIETEIGTRVQPGFDIGQRPAEDVFSGADTDVGQDTGFDVFAEFDQRSDVETEFETEQETDTETEAEFARELELFREVETETETETETESRRELFGGPDFEDGADGAGLGGFSGARGDIFTGFKNPLTGERL